MSKPLTERRITEIDKVVTFLDGQTTMKLLKHREREPTLITKQHKIMAIWPTGTSEKLLNDFFKQNES